MFLGNDGLLFWFGLRFKIVIPHEKKRKDPGINILPHIWKMLIRWTKRTTKYNILRKMLICSTCDNQHFLNFKQYVDSTCLKEQQNSQIAEKSWFKSSIRINTFSCWINMLIRWTERTTKNAILRKMLFCSTFDNQHFLNFKQYVDSTCLKEQQNLQIAQKRWFKSSIRINTCPILYCHFNSLHSILLIPLWSVEENNCVPIR